MSLPTPKIGDTNVRGYVLSPTDMGDISALPSLYGFYPCDVPNPLLFYVLGDCNFPPFTEVFFDLVAPQGAVALAGYAAMATNVRRA